MMTEVFCIYKRNKNRVICCYCIEEFISFRQLVVLFTLNFSLKASNDLLMIHYFSVIRCMANFDFRFSHSFSWVKKSFFGNRFSWLYPDPKASSRKHIEQVNSDFYSSPHRYKRKWRISSYSLNVSSLAATNWCGAA